MNWYQFRNLKSISPRNPIRDSHTCRLLSYSLQVPMMVYFAGVAKARLDEENRIEDQHLTNSDVNQSQPEKSYPLLYRGRTVAMDAFERALQFVTIGDYESANSEYGLIIDSEPDNSAAWYGMGVVEHARRYFRCD